MNLFFDRLIRPNVVLCLAIICMGCLYSSLVLAEEPEVEQSEVEEESEGHGEEFLTARDVVEDEQREEPTRRDLDEEELTELMGAMNAALQAEEAEDFELARDEFVKAYRYYPHSNILLSTARVSAEMGDREVAILGYRRFLERQPDYQNREEVERRIAEMEAELELEMAQANAEESEKFSISDMMPQTMPSTIGWIGAGTAVVGMISMIGGGRLASRVADDYVALEEAQQTRDRDEYARLYDDISSRQTRGKIFLYGGMGLTAAGLGLLVVDLFVLDEPALFGDSELGQVEIGSIGGEGVMMRWKSSF